MFIFLTFGALFTAYSGVDGLGACDHNDFFYGSVCKKTCKGVVIGKMGSTVSFNLSKKYFKIFKIKFYYLK